MPTSQATPAESPAESRPGRDAGSEGGEGAAADRDAPSAQTDVRTRRAAGFDRVLFLRHIAIFVGAVIAYYQHARHGMGWAAFGIVTASAALNFGCSFLHRRPRFAIRAEVASSVIGVGCWTALAAVTGGVSSPFIAGLWLEIVLAAMLFALAGIVSVTLWSIAAIWGLQLFRGLEGTVATLLLQSAFLLAMGSIAYAAARNALRTEDDLLRERDALDLRLRSLAGELEQERNVGRLGENVARLAHGLKNAVHSLRGFAALIEPTLGERGDARSALAGLRVAIDDLENLARLTLDVDRKPPAPSRAAVGVALERALHEMRVSHADVEWTIEGDADAPVGLSPSDLCEVLVILMRNAVEAMNGCGCARVSVAREGDRVTVTVCDSGRGFEAGVLERIFEPGYTTKPQGSGYGLYLARRLVTEAGGSIAARSAERGGAEIAIALPIVSRSARS